MNKRVIVCDHKSKSLLESLQDILKNHGHIVLPPVIEEDPAIAYKAISEIKPPPDVAIVDYKHEPEDYSKEIDQQWGLLLRSFLKSNSDTSGIRIIFRSKLLSSEDRDYLKSIGVPENDIIDAWVTSGKDLAKII